MFNPKPGQMQCDFHSNHVRCENVASIQKQYRGNIANLCPSHRWSGLTKARSTPLLSYEPK